MWNGLMQLIGEIQQTCTGTLPRSRLQPAGHNFRWSLSTIVPSSWLETQPPLAAPQRGRQIFEAEMAVAEWLPVEKKIKITQHSLKRAECGGRTLVRTLKANILQGQAGSLWTEGNAEQHRLCGSKKSHGEWKKLWYKHKIKCFSDSRPSSKY